jgi:hypothetical protein
MSAISSNKGIGWDIGIKNLAYCVVEQNPDSESNDAKDLITFNATKYAINSWADISLLKQVMNNMATGGEATSLASASQLTCVSPKTDKIGAPICGASTSYVHEELSADGAYRGYCKTHFKKIIASSTTTRMPTLPVNKCYHLDCTGKAAQVLKAHIYKGYCKKHITEFIKAGTNVADDFLKINRVKNAGKIDISQLGVALFQELDKLQNTILMPNIILLENQPVLKNPTMKSMQMFLYSYYLLRTLELNAKNKANDIGGASSASSASGASSLKESVLGDKYIQCYTASKKLDLIKFFPTEEQARINNSLAKVKSGYMKNKKMSILMVEYLLQGNARWLNFFKGHPKQDDLADSLLMTLHYFEKNNLAKLNKAAKKIKNSKASNSNKNDDMDGDGNEDVIDVGEDLECDDE